MTAAKARITLTQNERSELRRQSATADGRRDVGRRARVILMLADGRTGAEIRGELGCGDSYISRASKRFAADRLAGLFARYRGSPRHKVPDQLEGRVLAWTTQRKPADGSACWSSRKLAAALGGELSHTTVVRSWARHGLRPHEPPSNPVADDTDFEPESADVVGLYLNPPQHAVVFAVDDNREARPPGGSQSVRGGSAVTRGHGGSGCPHRGTLSLYEAIRSAAAKAPGKDPQRHTSAELAAFVTDVVGRPARGHGASRHRRPAVRVQGTAGQRPPGRTPQGSSPLPANPRSLAASHRVVARAYRARRRRAEGAADCVRAEANADALHSPQRQRG
jgi:transposase